MKPQSWNSLYAVFGFSLSFFWVRTWKLPGLGPCTMRLPKVQSKRVSLVAAYLYQYRTPHSKGIASPMFIAKA
eukprot:2550818-Rhodomonas_salina.2